MENLNYLFAAFTAVWAMIFFYVWMLARRNRGLEQEIQELRDLVDRRR